MKKSKPSEPVDRISKLPDHILHLILSCLKSTEEAVRASVLSTRWRFLWTSLPCIDIDCSRRLFKTGKKFKKKKFKEFVYYTVLQYKTLDLDSFRLCCSDYYNALTVEHWIHAAVMRKVKQLHLSFFPITRKGDDLASALPGCLVTCDSLEVLSLFLFRQPITFPCTTTFRGLRVLELNSVDLYTKEALAGFLDMCPLLEDLSLIDCVIWKLYFLDISSSKLKSLRIDNRKMIHYKEDCDDGSNIEKEYNSEGCCHGLHISCPKLQYFEYAGDFAFEVTSENLDSLKKAVIYPQFIVLDETISGLFAAVSNVESLSINHSFVQGIGDGRDLSEISPESLPNLKTLELTTKVDDFIKNVLTVILKCSPKSLNLIVQEEFSKSRGYNSWYLNEAETRGMLVTRLLKRVEFLEFNGEKEKLDIARFLLEHGNALEEMVFTWRNKAKYQEMSIKTMNIVSKFKKASSIVKLITLLKV